MRIAEGVEGEAVITRERFIYKDIARSTGVDEVIYYNSGPS